MKECAHLTSKSSSCIALVSDLYNKCQHNIIYDPIIINMERLFCSFSFSRLANYFARIANFNIIMTNTTTSDDCTDLILKEPQTISIYWFYLLCNHVDTSTNQIKVICYLHHSMSYVYVHSVSIQFISNKLGPSSLTWPAS